jgi:choline dehydrogenase-like flavoprotein
MAPQGFNVPNIIAGKAIGGSGVHNAMLYVRCTETDMERWNISNWSWEDMQSTYIQLEAFCADENSDDGSLNIDSGVPSFHGSSPPPATARARLPDLKLVTSRPPVQDMISRPFVAAAVGVGINFTDDFNAPGGRAGVGYYHFNIRDGVRDSVARRFLGPLLRPHIPLPPEGTLRGASLSSATYSTGSDNSNLLAENFDFAMGATVTKVLLKSTAALADPRASSSSSSLFLSSSWLFSDWRTDSRAEKLYPFAYGVEYVQGGQRMFAYLKKQPNSGAAGVPGAVVVAAGALMSPKVLMNSGIGPRDVLEASGVPVIVESPQVGPPLSIYIHICVDERTDPNVCAVVL